MSFSTTSVIFLTKGCWRNAFLFGFISEQQPGKGNEFRYTPEYLHFDGGPVSLILPKREDLGSGIRNILRYAPLYYSDYRIEINNGSQFIFSITYMDVAENVRDKAKMSETASQNVRDKAKMSETDPQNVRDNDISEEDLALEIGESPTVNEKKKRRKQGIVGLIASKPNITVDMLSEKMGVNEKTIRRDLAELREQGIIERVGGDFGGHWIICRKRH